MGGAVVLSVWASGAPWARSSRSGPDGTRHPAVARAARFRFRSKRAISDGAGKSSLTQISGVRSLSCPQAITLALQPVVCVCAEITVRQSIHRNRSTLQTTHPSRTMLSAINNAVDVDLLRSRADDHFAARRISEAAVCYRDILAVNPHDAHALHHMALALFHLDDLNEAFIFAQRAVHAAPTRADLLECAGLLAALGRKYDAAESLYRQAITLMGGTASLHRNLGDCLRRAGRLHEAIAHYEDALQIDPDLHHANRALAMINTELGHTDEALEFWLRAWTLRPAAPRDDLDPIAAIVKSGRTGSLDRAVEQITTHHADNPAALKAVAYVLNTSQRYEGAFEAARRGLSIAPDNALLSHSAAWALRHLGRIAECLPYCEAAARALPNDPKIQYYLADALLCLGKFDEGWKLHRRFYEVPEHKTTLPWPSFPVWNGEPVSRRRFLLVGEQGLGDQIQFLRFADWLYRQGATVDVLVSEQIVELASNMESVTNAFTTLPAGPYDFWAHMFTVPEYVQLDISMLPVSMPYLAASPEKMRKWQQRIATVSSDLARSTNRRIGIVWAGNPLHPLDRFRSIRIDALQGLFTIPSVNWYALQKGCGELDSEALGAEFDVWSLGPDIEGYADTLAILQSLDLLITVDSSVAHLAGAAGLPVWVLVPAYTDWRWLTERADSPWYPSMRLFRQRELGDWGPVIDEVRVALQTQAVRQHRLHSAGQL